MTTERPGRRRYAKRWAAMTWLVLALGSSGAQAQTPAAGTQAPTPPASGFSRWMDVQTASLQVRFRYIETSERVVTTRQMQDGVAVKARLKLDRKGRFSLTGAAGTGGTFTSAWNNTGIGTGDPVYGVALKQLFVSAVPVAGVDVSYGGFAPIRGESTEITSYDNDAYLVGQRISIRRRKTLFFDEISGTAAFLGDLATPNVFRRFDRLNEVNYGQVLVARKVTSWLAASADITRTARVATVRAAAAITVHGSPAIDTIRYEQYARAGGDGAFGFAVAGEKTALSRLTLSLGYADIDPAYGGLNGDRYNRGRRLFGTGTLRLSPELSVLVFAARAFHDQVTISNRARFDFVVTYNALATLKRAGLTR